MQLLYNLNICVLFKMNVDDGTFSAKFQFS